MRARHRLGIMRARHRLGERADVGVEKCDTRRMRKRGHRHPVGSLDGRKTDRSEDPGHLTRLRGKRNYACPAPPRRKGRWGCREMRYPQNAQTRASPPGGQSGRTQN